MIENREVGISLEQVLRTVDERPTVAAYVSAAREAHSFSEQLRPLKLCLLSTYTIDSLVPYLKVETARNGFAADVYIGPFNAARQELLDPRSGCLKHQPDIVFWAQLLCDVSPPLAEDFLALSRAQTEQCIEETVTSIVATLETFREYSPAPVIVNNFSLTSYPLLGIYEPMVKESQTQAIRQLNTCLVEAVKSVPGVYVLDFDRLCAEIGYLNCHNEKLWYLGRAPLSPQSMLVLARVQAAFVRTIFGGQRKCLVLDLDNTLWGGVIGENGIAGIKLGHAYPGNLFRQFQQTLLQLYRRGVLLAINSKNNRADVEEVFRLHPDMVLKLEYFASTRINWRSKHENMTDIAAELNLSLDSLVFFDDNPAERSLMRQMRPEVLTLEAPTDPLKYSQVLLESRAFDSLSFNHEDRRRGEMYQAQVERRQLKQSATSLQDFLSSLKMTVSIGPVDQFAFPRALDLIHKTNQFNLTSRRHSAKQLTDLIADPACGTFYLRVTDRFGDNGIVGLAIVLIRGAVAYVDTFILSCRVIGRTLETAFLSFLIDWARAQGMTAMEGEFIATAKNAPAADFYAGHNFTQVSGNGTGQWRLGMNEVTVQWPSYIQLNEEALEKA